MPMPMFKAVIATYNNTHAGGNIIAVVVCENFAVGWVEEQLAKEHPLATVLVSDVTTHWSAVIIPRPDPVAIEEYERHNRAETCGTGRYGW